MRTTVIPTAIGPLLTRNGWPTPVQLETLLIEALRRRNIGMKGNPVRVRLPYRATRRTRTRRKYPDVNARIVLYTHRFEIGIYAHIEGARGRIWSSYLSGDISDRRCEPGESWNRGGNLADGELNADTLESILEQALQQELAVPPHPHDRYIDEPIDREKHGKRLPH